MVLAASLEFIRALKIRDTTHGFQSNLEMFNQLQYETVHSALAHKLVI